MTTFTFERGGRWSGGGQAFLGNARLVEERHPELFGDTGTGHSITIYLRNAPTRVEKPYVLVPQNAWPWHGDTRGPKEFARLRVMRELAEYRLRRALGVIRMGPMLPAIGRQLGEILPNVLDEGFEDALAQIPDGPPVDEPYFVSVGSFNSYRGYDTLVAAYAQYRGAGGRAPLHVIGGGSASYADSLPHVEGLTLHRGGMSRAACLGWMRDALAVVLPSQVEASPMTVGEAFAVGAPVLASDIPGHRSVLGIGALTTFRSRDAADLAGHLLAPPPAVPAPVMDATERRRLRERWSDEFADRLRMAVR